jgi:hypothetical protein
MPDLSQLSYMDTYGRSLEESVNMLRDAYIRMRKDLEFYLSSLDEENISRITTDLLIAGKALISTALIEDLIVGGNVTIGPDARISWSQVTNQPYIPTSADMTNIATTIAASYIRTPNVIINDGSGTGSLNFNISGQYVTFKTSYTTGGNTLIIGKTTAVGQVPSLLERIDLMAGWLYVYNNLYVVSNLSIGGSPAATQSYADTAVSSAIATHIAAYHSA